MNNDLNNLTKMYGNKVVDLRLLYGFGLLLKSNILEFKKLIGERPSEEQSMQIFWNAMDPASKVISLQQKLDVEPSGYKELGEHVDFVHKMQFGALDFESQRERRSHETCTHG